MSEERTNTQGQPSEPKRGGDGKRRPYATPTITEYGSIARLTHTGGSTAKEGGSSKVRKGCL